VAVLFTWRRPVVESVLPAERFFGAMRTGLRYVRHAPEVIAVVVRGSVFVLCSSSLWALLPLVARLDLGQGPAGYGILLAGLGLGAVGAAMVLPRLRTSMDFLVAVSTLVFAGSTVALALVHSFVVICAAMVLAGGAWLSLLSSLNVSVQTVVPSWVKGRALSVYMLIFYAGLAGGSVLWGAVADVLGVTGSLLISAAGMVAGLVATARLHLSSGEGLNLSPSRQWPAPIIRHELEPERGPVLVTVEYQVAPDQARAFVRAMDQIRRIRLRDGAFQWGLFVDAADPGRHTEIFLVKSWLEHLRQHERVTWADRDVEERARAFHMGPEAPKTQHLIAEPVVRT
jgi:MFS family permease